jgi:hypothetical protein
MIADLEAELKVKVSTSASAQTGAAKALGCRSGKDKGHSRRNHLIELVRKDFGRKWRGGIADAHAPAVDTATFAVG